MNVEDQRKQIQRYEIRLVVLLLFKSRFLGVFGLFNSL